MKKIRLIFICLFIVISFAGFGQNNIGLSSGNYAGIYGVYNNPAYIQNNFTYQDATLLGLGAYINNNYITLKKEDHSIFKFMSLDFSFPTFIDELGRRKEIDEIYNTSLKQAYQQVFINGLSYMQSYGRFGFSISTRGREFLNVKNLSYDLAKFLYEDLDFEPLHNVVFDNRIDQSFDHFSVTEIAAGFAYNVYSRYYTKVDVGVSAKYLMPISGVKLYIDDVNYYLVDDNTLVINEMNGTFDASVPYDFATREIPGQGGWIKGNGFGLDVGVFVTKTKRLVSRRQRVKRAREIKKTKYEYRFGVSLNDIGFVNFNHNVTSHKYVNASTYWPNIHDVNYENVYGIMETISERLMGNPQASNTGKTSFRKILPTYLNVQFDYSFSEHLYINSLFAFNMKAKHNSFEKPDYMAVMPRFEKAAWSFGIPLSLHDYRVPQVGFHARIYFLSFGVENIIPYLGLDDLNAGDFYISLSFFLEKGHKGRKSHGCTGYEYKKYNRWK